MIKFIAIELIFIIIYFKYVCNYEKSSQKTIAMDTPLITTHITSTHTTDSTSPLTSSLTTPPTHTTVQIVIHQTPSTTTSLTNTPPIDSNTLPIVIPQITTALETTPQKFEDWNKMGCIFSLMSCLISLLQLGDIHIATRTFCVAHLVRFWPNLINLILKLI